MATLVCCDCRSITARASSTQIRCHACSLVRRRKLTREFYAKKSRVKNRTKIAERRRAYCAAHRAEIAEYKRAYRAAHRAEIAERMRAYASAHREEYTASTRRYRSSKMMAEIHFVLRHALS